MRASRAYLAGLGTAGSLVIGAILLFAMGSAVVAFHGWRPLGIGSPATQTLQAQGARVREHRAQVAAATAALTRPRGAGPIALIGAARLPVAVPHGSLATLPGHARVGGGRGHKVRPSVSHGHPATRRGHGPAATAPTSTTTTPTAPSPATAAPAPTPATASPVTTTPSPAVTVTVPVVSRPVNPPRHGVPSVLKKIGTVVSPGHPVTHPTAPPPEHHPIPHPGPPPGVHPGPPAGPHPGPPPGHPSPPTPPDPSPGHGPHGPGPHGPGPHGPSPVPPGPPPGPPSGPSIGIPSPGQGLHHPGPPPGIGPGGDGPPGHGLGHAHG